MQPLAYSVSCIATVGAGELLTEPAATASKGLYLCTVGPFSDKIFVPGREKKGREGKGSPGGKEIGNLGEVVIVAGIEHSNARRRHCVALCTEQRDAMSLLHSSKQSPVTAGTRDLMLSSCSRSA